jgi:hypothetical protein
MLRYRAQPDSPTPEPAVPARIVAEVLRVTGSGGLLAGQPTGKDQLLVQFEPDSVVGVDGRPGQPGGIAGFNFFQRCT